MGQANEKSQVGENSPGFGDHSKSLKRFCERFSKSSWPILAKLFRNKKFRALGKDKGKVE